MPHLHLPGSGNKKKYAAFGIGDAESEDHEIHRTGGPSIEQHLVDGKGGGGGSSSSISNDVDDAATVVAGRGAVAGSGTSTARGGRMMQHPGLIGLEEEGAGGRRRGGSSICVFRMSASQLGFLAIFVTSILYFTIDSLTQRNSLSLLNEALMNVEPPTAIVISFAFVGLSLMFVTLGFPISLLSVLGGFVYSRTLGSYLGVLVASIVVTITSSIGCIVTFLLARGMLRDCASEWLHSTDLLEGLDEALKEQGLKVNLLLRLSPIVPYNLMNLLMGMTATRLEDYTIGCVIGMLPSVILLAYFGTGLESLEDIASFAARRHVEMSILYISGAIILVLVILMLIRATRRAVETVVKRKQSLVDSSGWEM